jgi:hypothetical protein
MGIIDHPLLRITSTLFLATLLLLPFINGMIKNEYNDLIILSTYFTVACYIVLKKIYDIFKPRV